MSQTKKENKLVLTNDQSHVFEKMVDFIRQSEKRVFILRGYAGTGKTTMMTELIAELTRRNEPFSLHASTGRAAKILSDKTKTVASTVHSLIYNFKGFNMDVEKVMQGKNDGPLLLLFDSNNVDGSESECYYIIDESSMISDTEDKNPSQALFGNGKLLTDLINFNPKAKFVFVGDVCQLPPINTSFSPALDPDYIERTFGLGTEMCELTQIMRQQDGNDIVHAAKKVRMLYANPPMVKWAKFPLRGYKNIKLASDQMTLIEQYISDVKKNGLTHATMITRSNAAANKLTKFIRPALGYSSPRAVVGDLLLVTQNNAQGLMNGDMVVITQIGASQRRAELTFTHVEVEEMFRKTKHTLLMIEEVLYGSYTNLSQNQQQALFVDFYIRMKQKNLKQGEMYEFMRTDPYLNALRATFGYVLTCHKSQGGEWPEVYVDIPRNLALNATSEAYQWLYTAMTRASENLHVVDDFYIG